MRNEDDEEEEDDNAEEGAANTFANGGIVENAIGVGEFDTTCSFITALDLLLPALGMLLVDPKAIFFGINCSCSGMGEEAALLDAWDEPLATLPPQQQLPDPEWGP